MEDTHVYIDYTVSFLYRKSPKQKQNHTMSVNSEIAMLLAGQAYVITSAGLYTDKTNSVQATTQEDTQTSASCSIFFAQSTKMLLLFDNSRAHRCNKIAQNMLEYGC